MISQQRALPGVRAAERRGPSKLRASIGRHPRDIIRLIVAGVVVAVCAMLARLPAVNPIEAAVFAEVARMPPASRSVWVAFTWLGYWPGIVAVTAVALYTKRIRLGLKSAAAGALAWGMTAVIHWILGARPPPVPLVGMPPVLAPATGFWFPAVHVAIAAALITVTGPYLKPIARNIGWAVTALVAVADVAVGGHLPLGAFAGAFLGWGVGTLMHLVWGAPGRKTSDEAIRRTLDLAGLKPVTMVPVKHHVLVPREYDVSTEGGERLRVQVVARLHRRAGLAYKLRRLLASLEVEDEPKLSTTHHEVEHEAFVTILAERAGVRTPPLVLACEIEHGSPLLVRKHVNGQRLTTIPRDRVDDELLVEVWRQIAALGEARIAHHDLRAKNILVDDLGRPWLLNFTFGRAGADRRHCAQDMAEAMLSLASVAGVQRAVHSACTALPREQLAEVLPYLHPLALPRRIRAQARDGRYLLYELREALAEEIDCPVPGFRSPVRVSTVISLVLFGAAVYVLLPQLSSMSKVLASLHEANWWWLAAAVITGFIAIVMSAISIQGSSPSKLPFWRTTAVQLAAAFTGRTTPGGAGFFGINIAFLEKLHFRRSRAVGVTLLNLAATGFVGAVYCIAGIFGVGLTGALHDISIPTGWPVLAGGAGVLIVLGGVIGSPFGRRRIVRPGLEICRELLCTLHHPVRAAQLFGGALAYHVVSALGLAASLAAFEPNFPVVAVLTIFVIGQTLGHLAPAPGGLGAVEAVTVAGLTAVGIPATAAVAAVLTSRLLTYWLPVLPGIAMFRYLQHRQLI